MKRIFLLTTIIILFSSSIAACTDVSGETSVITTPAVTDTVTSLPASSITPTLNTDQLTPTPDLLAYAFPELIDPSKQYMFYLHGKIIEDQGIPAISPDYGEYEYAAILEKLSAHGFVVISEQRQKDTDSLEYAKRIAVQVTDLLKAGVPPKNITIVGASKGGGIAILASNLLKNKDLNFVIMGICDPGTVDELIRNKVALYGNVLSIYDSADVYAGSCRELFTYSEGKGISRYDEIVLDVGTGHGVLYHPLDEWILPTVRWAGKS